MTFDLHSFFLGLMVAYLPGLVLIAVHLRRVKS